MKDLDCVKVTQLSKANEILPSVDLVVPGKGGNDLTSKRLNFGGNSGFAALHLALIWGASKVVLLGYDMKGGSHWFGKHPDALTRQPNYSSFVGNFDNAKKPDTPIINCSRDTALTSFPKATIQDVL